MWRRLGGTGSVTAMANVEQSDYWNAGAGEAWVRQQDRMDIQLAPLGDATMAGPSHRPVSH